MKKIILALIFSLLLLGVCACSSDEQEIRHKVYVLVDSNTSTSHESDISLLTNIDNSEVQFRKIYENIFFTDIEKIDFLVSAEEKDRLLHIFVWVDNHLVINQKGYLDLSVSYTIQIDGK